MEKFVGKWELHSSTNFDEYMKELGVGVLLRKFANNNKPIQEIVVEDKWTTITMLSPCRTTEIKFQIDEEFEEVTGDDRLVKSITKKESDTKFVQIQNRDVESKITRELIGDEYVMTLEYNNVAAVRTYRKID